MQGLELGDLYVAGKHPPKLMKALAVTSAFLHDALDETPLIERGKSKRSCILASLTVRDFLRAIGFPDAQARPVGTIMHATQDGEQLHSLGVGIPAIRQDEEPGNWIGHMVVTLASTRTLIDTTLYQCRRKQWEHLPGMLAVKMTKHLGAEHYGLQRIAGLTNRDGGYSFYIVWLDDSENTGWHEAPDTDPLRRRAAVQRLIEQFGEWQ